MAATLPSLQSPLSLPALLSQHKASGLSGGDCVNRKGPEAECLRLGGGDGWVVGKVAPVSLFSPCLTPELTPPSPHNLSLVAHAGGWDGIVDASSITSSSSPCHSCSRSSSVLCSPAPTPVSQPEVTALWLRFLLPADHFS